MKAGRRKTVEVDVTTCDLCDSEVDTVERSDDQPQFMPVRCTYKVTVELIHDELDREEADDVDLCRACRGELAAFLQSRADHHRGDVTA